MVRLVELKGDLRNLTISPTSAVWVLGNWVGFKPGSLSYRLVRRDWWVCHRLGCVRADNMKLHTIPLSCPCSAYLTNLMSLSKVAVPNKFASGLHREQDIRNGMCPGTKTVGLGVSKESERESECTVRQVWVYTVKLGVRKDGDLDVYFLCASVDTQCTRVNWHKSESGWVR